MRISSILSHDGFLGIDLTDNCNVKKLLELDAWGNTKKCRNKKVGD